MGFCIGGQFAFRLSLDNLNNPTGDAETFREQVYARLTDYFELGFPTRALRMIQMLCRYYRQGQPIQIPDISSCSI